MERGVVSAGVPATSCKEDAVPSGDTLAVGAGTELEINKKMR